MVFVIHWHESAMDLHVFPIPIPPPTSLSTRSLWVFPVYQARALVSCHFIQPHLFCSWGSGQLLSAAPSCSNWWGPNKIPFLQIMTWAISTEKIVGPFAVQEGLEVLAHPCGHVITWPYFQNSRKGFWNGGYSPTASCLRFWTQRTIRFNWRFWSVWKCTWNKESSHSPTL